MNSHAAYIPPLTALGKLAVIVSGYRSSNAERCVFRSISDAFYRENFHSDLLAYYLEEPLVKRKLIDWLNEGREEKDRLIYSEYEYGKVMREDRRIDILLLSNDGSEAILIESKSNDADDQFRQLPRYVEALSRNNCETMAILYLTLSTTKNATTEDWTTDEVSAIRKLICPAKLVGGGSFAEKLIDPVLQESNDIRLSGLSLEIKKLFHYLVYGDINMSTLAEFAAELKEGKNYDQLKQIIKAYNDLPRFWRDTYKHKIEDVFRKRPVGGTNVQIGLYKQTCVYVDRIYIEGKHIAVDTVFSHDCVEISVVGRAGCSENDIDGIKGSFGETWPFSDERDESLKRYIKRINSPFDEQAILSFLEQVFTTFGVLLASANGVD